MTHLDLVHRAGRWLRNTRKCKIVLLESGHYSIREIPDAIGWRSPRCSLLVECKTSRSDLRADRKKSFRKEAGRGCGLYRYMMAEPGLIKIEDLEGPHEGWGLLEVHSRSVRVVQKSRRFIKRNIEGEAGILFSELSLYRRIIDGGHDVLKSARTVRMFKELGRSPSWESDPGWESKGSGI